MIRFLFFSLLFCWVPFVSCEILALDGYDVVTYFTEPEPERGLERYSVELEGRTWVFVSEENLEKFKDDPSKYKPQYDGWCALAMSDGRLSEGVPRYYSVEDGKLYIFCSEATLKQWELNPREHRLRADKFWEEMTNHL